MTNQSTIASSLSMAVFAVMAVMILLAMPEVSRAADSTLGASLCEVIKQLLPEVKSFEPEGARAQLVMAVAEKFEYDANKLRQVRAEIDQAATAACPNERARILDVLKMKSLAEAVS